MEWKLSLAQATNLPAKTFSTMSNGEVVKKLFEGCIFPGIEVAMDGVTLDISDKFNINKIHGSVKFYKLLSDKALFNSLPMYIRKSTLDILCFTLRRSVHDVARFRHCEPMFQFGFVDILLSLLSDLVLMDRDNLLEDDILIAKRLIRLIGVVAVCGMSIPELKKFLGLLRTPTLFSTSLLQTLKAMLAVNDAIVKAYPLSFFDFCDSKDGLSIAPFSFPFSKEYQVSFWFRVDKFSQKNTKSVQYLFTYMNNTNGLMIFIEGGVLCVSVSNGPSESTLIKCDVSISEGVWYHLSVSHNKLRMSLFAKHEMTISVDGSLCFQDIVRFPSSTSIDNMTNASIGKSFDGQIGPVYIFNEVIPASSIDAIAWRDAGKQRKESLKKSIASKVQSIYQPQRCDGRQVVDYHGGHHAVLGESAHVCNIVPVRETLSSLGGIACLLPLFPNLLVEHEVLRGELHAYSAARHVLMPPGWEAAGDGGVRRKPSTIGYSSTNVGLGTSLYEIMTDEDLPRIFGVKTIEKMDTFDIFELQDDKPIGLLVSSMARCMRQHSTHQSTFMEVGGVQMISYCLRRITSDSRILKEEDESLILALLQLRDSVGSFPGLETLVMRELVCNISIWSAGSFKLQTSLYSVILANIKAQTSFFVDVLGVQSIIDFMEEFYLHADQTQESHSTLVYVSAPLSDSAGGEIVQKVEGGGTPPKPASRRTNLKKQKAKSLIVSSSAASMFEHIAEDNPEHASCANESTIVGGNEGDASNCTKLLEHDREHTPQHPHRMRRRGSGSSSFLRSVSRRMSATEVSLPTTDVSSPDVQRVTNTSSSGSRPVMLTAKARSMSVKFSDNSLRSLGISSSDMVEEGEQEKSEDGEEEDDNRACVATKLSDEQRRSIRGILQSMIIVLSMHRCSIHEVEPLFFFLQNCEDNVVLDEIAQLLLCIVVGDNSFRIVTTMMDLFKGPEDFLSFVLNRLDHRPCEPLRCTFFALLIEFYLRVDSLPTSLATAIPSKIKKGSLLQKNRDKYVGEGQALQRMEACGGLASMCMLLNANKKECGKETYSSLFSLLFTNRASDVHINPFFKQLFKESIASTSTSGSDLPQDESQEIMNPTMLIAYFYFVPKLPMSVQEGAHCDLLAMLKHNPKNREVFRENISWHLCMYDLVSQLVTVKGAGNPAVLNSAEVLGFLQEWAFFQRPHKDDDITHLFIGRAHSHSHSHSPSRPRRDVPGSPSWNPPSRKGREATLREKSSEANMLEMWFDIGMKTYATMLVHGMDMAGGFIEVQRTASQSYESTRGTAVTLSIFSHLLHELTFTLQSKYKDMQRMARSTSSEDVAEATNKLENMLSIIVLLSLYLYEKDSIAVLGVPNLAQARKRCAIFDRVRKNQGGKQACEATCTEQTHSELCSIALDKCNLCGHSLSLHVLDKKNTMDLVEEQMLIEEEDRGLDRTLGDEMEAPISVEEHNWMDLRTGVGYPPEAGSSPRRTSSGKKNIFTEETLNPLERGYEMARGKMVVSLQVLRYFDMIFWPEENRFRNNHLLNFDIPVNRGSPRKITKTQSPMTMYSSVLRTSLFVFHGLSPFTEMAERNVRRLEHLVKIIEQVPHTCPTNEWTLVILAHVTLALKRICSSIGSIYEMLGMDVYFSDSCASDKLFSDRAITDKINTLFNHPAGKQLVQYINSCITLLVTLYSTRKDFLSSRLDDKAFLALTLFVQNTQNFQFHVPSVKEQFTFTKSPSENLGGVDTRRRSSDEMEDSPCEAFRPPPSPKSNRHSPFRTRSSNFKTRQASVSNFSIDSADQECDEKVCEDALYALCFLRDPFLHIDITRSESVLLALFALEKFELDSSVTYLKDMEKLQDELMVKRNLIGNYMNEIDELTDLGKEVKQMILAKDSSRKSNKSVRLEISTKASATFWNKCLRMFEESWSPWSSEYKDREGDSRYTASVHRDSSMRRMVMFRNDENIDYTDAAYFEGKLRDQLDFDGAEGLVDEEDDDVDGGKEGGVGTTLVQTPALSFMKDTLQLTRPKAHKLNTVDSVTGDTSDNDNDSTEDAEETTIDVKRDNNIFSSVLNSNVEKRPLWALTFTWHADEREIFSAEVMEIMTEQVLSGTVLLTNRSIYFHPKKRNGGFLVRPDEFRNKRWHLSKMTECYGRRYLLQNCGIELFFSNAPEIFFAFNTHKESQRFFRYLKKQPLPSLESPLSLSPSVIFQQSTWTELWKKRSISNFEYIMRLNIIAGRSYNDITQYPVFPWILNDYESPTLDLNDPSVYRDLSKPVGALNPARLDEILDRYKSFGEMDMPQFMYGSHYSSAGLILHFMIRQEPFTSMAITLQGGRFDCPDRLFFNLKETWKCCNTSMSDVKELVPQMFYFPEAFVNNNSLPLGDLQDDRGEVEDVVLPPWCNGDPFEFVRIHREALESEYVSEHLHEWIDLIFGFKQTGPAAVEANNVFHYLTYENAIDIEAITDPLQKAAAKAQVTHFGQTPSQVTAKEHPKRNSVKDCVMSFCAYPSSEYLDRLQCYLHPKQCGMNNEHGAVVAFNCSSSQLIVCYADFTVAYHKWSTVPETNKTPFSLKFDKSRVLPSASSSMFYHHLSESGDSDEGIDRKSLLRSRASSYGEGILAAGSSLFRRSSGLFSQEDGGGRTRSVETVSTSPSLTLKVEGTTEDLNCNVDEGDVESIRSRSSTDDTIPSKAVDSLSDDNSIDSCTVTRPSLEKIPTVKKLRNRHVSIKMSEGGSGFIFSCGYWNHFMKVHTLKDSPVEVLCSSGGHIGHITCLALGSGQQALITGGEDGTCRVWHIQSGMDLSLDHQHVLLGHAGPVTAVAFSSHHDLVLSASSNGFLCLHTAQRGLFVRSIATLCTETSHPVEQLEISIAGYLVTHSPSDFSMDLFWINGQHLKHTVLESSVECMIFNKAGSVLFCGLASGEVAVLRTWDLKRICSIDLAEFGSITCMKLVADDQYLLIGSEKGAFHVGTDPEARWKVLHSIISMNPLTSTL